MSKLYEFDINKIIENKRANKENIDEILNWLKTTKFNQLPEDLIVLFLISCENNIDLTKNTINEYFKCKKESPEIFNDRDIDREDLQQGLRTIQMASIPQRTKDDDVIHFFKIKDTDYTNFHLLPIMKLSYMILDISQRRNPPIGLIVVIDMKGLGLMHLTRLKLNALKKYFHFLQEGFPMKLKVIHLINSVYFIDKIMNIIKVFMKSELIDMLKIHPPTKDLKKLHEFISPECLPEEYGGKCPSMDELNEMTIAEFRELKGFYEAEEQLRKNF